MAQIVVPLINRDAQNTGEHIFIQLVVMFDRFVDVDVRFSLDILIGCSTYCAMFPLRMLVVSYDLGACGSPIVRVGLSPAAGREKVAGRRETGNVVAD